MELADCKKTLGAGITWKNGDTVKQIAFAQVDTYCSKERSTGLLTITSGRTLFGLYPGILNRPIN